MQILLFYILACGLLPASGSYISDPLQVKDRLGVEKGYIFKHLK